MNDRQLTDREIEAVLHAAARHDFPVFVEVMHQAITGERFDLQPFHTAMFDFLLRVYSGEITRAIINLPPRAGKTSLMLLFMAWCQGRHPDSNSIITSYGSDLAERSSLQLQQIMAHHVYGRIFPAARVAADATARDRWATTAGGEVRAVGTGGAVTGFGAGRLRDDASYGGCILLDDPIKAAEARSQVARDAAADFYFGTLRSRRNSPQTPVILICQRLHEDDLAGRLLGGASGEPWEHLNITVLDDEEVSFWPRRFPVAEMVALRTAQPMIYAAQYMQRPAPLEGGLFKPDQITVVDSVPTGTVHWVRAWDLASTTNGDYTAGAKMGKLPDGRVVIADMVRLRAGPDDRDAAIVGAAARDGRYTRIGIPQDPGAAGKVQVLYLTRKLEGFRVISSPESGDKVTRAEPFASQVNVGNVLMLRGVWNDALVNEMRMFPNGTHDDQVDAMSRAFSELIVPPQPARSVMFLFMAR